MQAACFAKRNLTFCKFSGWMNQEQAVTVDILSKGNQPPFQLELQQDKCLFHLRHLAHPVR